MVPRRKLNEVMETEMRFGSLSVVNSANNDPAKVKRENLPVVRRSSCGKKNMITMLLSLVKYYVLCPTCIHSLMVLSARAAGVYTCWMDATPPFILCFALHLYELT